jgi:hypothetical protein
MMLLNLERFYGKLGVFNATQMKSILAETLEKTELFVVSLKVIKSLLVQNSNKFALEYQCLCPMVLKNTFNLLKNNQLEIFKEVFPLLSLMIKKAANFFQQNIQDAVQFSLLCRDMIPSESRQVIQSNVVRFGFQCLFYTCEHNMERLDFLITQKGTLISNIS